MKKHWGKKPAHIRPESPALEWARDVTGGCARATSIGNRSLLVENHTAIADFCETRVLLNTRTGPLCVTGSGLSLRQVRPGALIVHGNIRRVDLPCEGGDAPYEP